MSIAAQGILTKIMVAVGGSESSFSALNYAIDFAQAGPRCVKALIVQEALIPPELALASGHTLGLLADKLAQAAERIADQTERRVREVSARRETSVEVERQAGHVSECVVAAAAQASLVVLGRQGHRADRLGLLGSNTESIVRRAHKPLLITPAQHRRVRRTLVAYGGKDLGESALATGHEIAEALCVPLEVLTVAATTPAGAAIQERARLSIAATTPAPTFSVKSGDPAAAIIARCTGDTLVVMGAYGHSRLYHMVLGSVTEQVVRFAQGPVLLSAKLVTPTGQ